MNRRTQILTLTLALALLAFARPGGAEEPGPSELREGLRVRVERLASIGGPVTETESLYASQGLPRFYLEGSLLPVWVGSPQALDRARRMAAILGGAEAEGLRSADYHLAAIEAGLAASGRAGAAALLDLELLLTDSALVFANHLLAGRLDPETVNPEWTLGRRQVDIISFLHDAIESGQLEKEYAQLLPRYPGYVGLRQALGHLRDVALAGGWPEVPGGATLRPGERDSRVTALRSRLAATGDLEEAAAPSADEDLFDERLEEAVKRFQARHGLDPDGVVGEQSYAALSVTAAERADQIVVNLERWRWLPLDLGDPHVRVNLAGFDLQARGTGRSDLDMRVIVGKTYARTPVFSNEIRYLVFHPYWNVPPSIGAGEIAPRAGREPDYLAKEGIRVFRDASLSEEVDPAAVDWTDPASRRLAFRQDPGARNALGKVKFMFPNRYNVYLHDTADRRLFQRAGRSLSHGCIRVEKPRDLAVWLLAGPGGRTEQEIDSWLEGTTQRTVTLAKPVPVHLLYWTAWVGPDSTLQFRQDVYERDAPVREALSEGPPSPAAG